jgi:hypothetical protein
MKKIILLIISTTLFFSTINNAFATKTYSEWYIEKFLDLNIWIEEYDLNLAHIEEIYFRDYNSQMLFEEFKRTSNLLNDEWDFEYYQVNWIISNQKKFIYHINRLFYYISFKESNPYYNQTDDLILEHYSVARTYYKRVQALIYKTY